ncbi:D-serine ammonia-lyase [Bombilactobacillus bombi]|uniref:D-serine ammonia-lyase n=1 Tax=Bombilactobacillus bombi TaxID=1303590 RepID=UPI002810ECC6|nr:D-serine ammonia-lyase [Bombilactobacillus bombi]
MESKIAEKLAALPIIQQLKDYQPLFWKNPDYNQDDPDLPFSKEYIFDAVARWERFAPYLAVAFPETAALHGVIESPLTKIPHMQQAWSKYNDYSLPGNLYIKQDNALPISGSIKSRGGIYEVLKFAEHVAMTEGDLTYMDDYSVLATPRYRKIFSHYGITAGSTGNLGLSIGIAAATFGFQTTIHMSHDARAWKKDKLRANGVNVIEHDGDCNFAVHQARKQAENDPHTYFIDDEGSKDLFLGYAVAAVRLQKQLVQQHILIDQDHPVFVYLPAGVGGSPGGVTFGLKQIIGANIHAIFAEPTHVPSVVLGMATGLNHDISVYDIGLDGLTQADGLAVCRPSVLAGRVMKTLLCGCATFADSEILKYVTLLADSENIKIEPSAAAGFAVIKPTSLALTNDYNLTNATHIVWSTGGDMVPPTDMQKFYEQGQSLLNSTAD